jgi:hypothetical protein
MGMSSVVVRFEDGTIRHALFQNTSDVIVARLYDSYDAARAGHDDPTVDDWDPGDGPREPVEIAIHYAGGETLKGVATRQAIVSPLDPAGDPVIIGGLLYDYENVPESVDGTPDWADCR